MTNAQILISMAVAIACNASRCCRISVTANRATIAILSLGVVLTFITASKSPFTCRVVVAATVNRAVEVCPAEIADAFKVGVVRTVAMVTSFDAGLVASIATVANEAFVAFTTKIGNFF